MTDERHTTSIPPGIAAAATYFFPFLGGLVMLGIEKEDRLVRFHAAQSIVFWLAVIPWALLSMIPLIGWLFAVTFIVTWVFLMYQAWTGREFEIPYLGAIARMQVFGEETGSGAAEGPEQPRSTTGPSDGREPPVSGKSPEE